MAKRSREKSSDIKQPSEAQLKARAKFAEQAKNRAGYQVSVKLNGKEYNCKTQDLADAFEQLGKENKIIKTRMLLTIKKAGKTAEKMLFVRQIKSLFSNKVYRNFFIKNLIFK